MESYLDERRVREAVAVFKTFAEKYEESGNDKKKKVLVLPSMEKLMLQIVWKKTPENKSTFDNAIGPLPHPWFSATESDVCFIVRDPNPKVFMKDRELDLDETRDIYKQKLLDAGFDDDFLNQKLNILPMRELITEYKEIEAKSKLCAAYDVFLADHRLMNNKHKSLNTFLGRKFFVERKKIPIPIRIAKLEGEELKREIMNSLNKTHLYVNGRGSECSVQIGLMNQTVEELSDNLTIVLKDVKKLFGDNISFLKLKTPKSFAIPIFADLRSKNDINVRDICPKSRSAKQKIVDDFSLFNNSVVVIDQKGNFRLKRKKVEDEDADPDDDFVNEMEKQWIKITNARRRKKRSIISFIPPGERRKTHNSTTVENKEKTLS